MMDCGCGRSPTGKCIGWHSLSEGEYKKKLEEYNKKNPKKKIDLFLWKFNRVNQFLP